MANHVRDKGGAFLGDLLVLDLADETGSFCSKLLADLGAIVIKVSGPAPGKGHTEEGEGIDPSFFYHNTNKLGLTLDPDRPEGRKAFRGTVREADVLVETFSPGRPNPFGVTPSMVARLNPRLVHLSITGFGRTGPRRRFRSTDIVASAFGGQTYVSGLPTEAPRAPFGAQPSYVSSIFGAIAVLLALEERRVTGKGQHIDLSTQEAIASTLDHVMVDYFSRGTIARRQGSVYGEKAFSILPCRDGHVQIPVLQNWVTILELMSSEGRAEDLVGKDWQDEAFRLAHYDHLSDVVGRWAACHSKNELFELGQAMRFPWAPICSPPEVIASPQLAARQFFVEAAMAGGATMRLPGLPYRFRSFSPPPPKPAPFQDEALEGPDSIMEKARARFKEEAPLPSPLADGAPLAGLRVLDLTWMLAGPYATRILADFGAEVIKVQSRKTARGAEENKGPYFAAWNRNKRSVTLDLTRPEAKDIFLRLVAVSDVLVESFSRRVMENWGLSYDKVREAKADVIMASISAMGQSGPWKDFVGFGPTFHALSGLIYQTSCGLDSPISLGHAYGDVVIGLYGALAVLASLRRKGKTGEGEYVDLSGYEAICTLLGPALLEAALGRNGSRDGSARYTGPSDVPYGSYPCLGDDRWCAIAVLDDRDWQAFCTAVDLPRLREATFSTKEGRRAHSAEIDALIGAWTAVRPAEEIVLLLQRVGVAAGLVQDARDLARDCHLASRGFFLSLDHQVLGETFSDRSALGPQGPAENRWRAAPLLGEDNDYVFGRLLGLSEAEIRAFEKKGIIG